MRCSQLFISGAVFTFALTVSLPLYAGNNAAMGPALGASLNAQAGRSSAQVATTGVGVAADGLTHNTMEEKTDISRSYPISDTSSIYSDQPPIPYNNHPTPHYVAPPAPAPTYVDQNNTYCRPYSQEMHIDGQIHESYGTACLQADGSWRVVQ